MQGGIGHLFPFRGLRPRRGMSLRTNAVVESIVAVILFDAIFTSLVYYAF